MVIASYTRKTGLCGLLALCLMVLSVAVPGPWSSARAQSLPDSRDHIRLSFAPLVRKVAPAVVSISSKRVVTTRVNPFMNDPFFAPFFQQGFGGIPRQRVESALGSGVIVDPSGLVVTNAHVVRGADMITVALADGREFEGKVSLADDASDLAVVQILALNESLPSAPLTSSESLEVGDLVIAIGNPFGVGQTVTSGIVSARARPNLDINDFNFFIQTDAAINPGNSGGPLVDMNGGIVGINTAIYSRDGGSLGIGFAIPAEMVKTVVAAERNGGADSGGVVRAWLGVRMQDMTPDIARSVGLDRPRGAMVVKVARGSPADDAGLQVGDAILAVNGRDVANAAEMHYRWATVPLGEEAAFQVWRQNRTLSLNVPARLPPDTPARNETLIKGRSALSGVTVAAINPRVAAEFGLPDDAEGVAIVKIDSRSSAARFLDKGDILLSLNGRDIQQPDDVQRALSATGSRTLVLIFDRRGAVQKLLVR